MAGARAGLRGQIHRLWDLGTFTGLSDAELLARFAAGHGRGAELAFEALVERHGPMVCRVCRGVLRDEHAAEDAFHATLSERTCKTMMLSKLKPLAAALVLGVVTAGAVMSAQQPGEGRTEPPDPTSKSGRTAKTVAAKGGNLIVDWIPVDGQGGKQEITVDPRWHCIHLLPWSLKRDDRPNDGALRVDLERGKYYKITAAGEAFMSEQTGPNADPFPGVVVHYPTDEQDCYAERQIVLAPGKSITFRSPWLIDPASGVHLMAFFIDAGWAGHPKRGSYTLTIEETGEGAVHEHAMESPFDGIVTKRELRHITVTRGAAQKRDDVPKDSAPPERPGPTP
jgi:hypothetical protein